MACFSISLVNSCSNISFGGSEPESNSAPSTFEKPQTVARISSPEVTESSGLAVSKCQADTFWTHNDSGDGPFLYAFDSSGKKLGTWRVSDAANVDWEDMATVKAKDGNCYLYIGEIGDNSRKRDVHYVYRVLEPQVLKVAQPSSRKEPTSAGKPNVLKFRYSNGRHDAEALLVHPATEGIYVITKELSGPAEVFKLDPHFDVEAIQTATPVGSISLPAIPTGFLTGADISTDGKRVVLCDYYSGYELTLPDTADPFDEIWTQKLTPFELGPRDIGESIAYDEGGDTVFATTEKKNPPLIRVFRTRQKIKDR
jgi:hypothetical protein